MTHINNIPYTGSCSFLSLPPVNALKATSDTVATAVAASKTLEAGCQMIELQAQTNGFYWRWLTAEDDDACTASNAFGYVQPGMYRWYGVPDNAVGISALAREGASIGTLIEY
jgi:hypothetical protein